MRRSRGYILPLALVLIALSGAALAKICRQNMRAALASTDDCRQLQHKWGMLSCQSVALANAGALLSAVSGQTSAVPPSLELELSLGGHQYRLRLSDEQAKVNLNMLYHARGRPETERFVGAAARAARGLGPISLRPMHFYGENNGSAATMAMRFGSFGQVFKDSGSVGDAKAIMQATRSFTCWGDGKLDYRHASPIEIAALAGNDPKLLKTILTRKSQPAAAALAFNPLNFQDRNGKNLDDLFTETSNCFSVWIVVDDGTESQVTFCVREFGRDGRGHLTYLSW
ncbi:MAG TPA: hypothetical protein VG326_00140 [Tepidisphaeraceae bacterium]|jgi:hypothetical protein|nr:hypothetical protein [Tepidisphaeraceae bacterium]